MKTAHTMSSWEITEYLEKNCVPIKRIGDGHMDRNSFYIVQKPLYGYKKTFVEDKDIGRSFPCITNLIIPQDSIIHLDPEDIYWGQKLRTSKAYVHSSWDMSHKCYVENSGSGFSGKMPITYKPGTWVHPLSPFSMKNKSCDSGIHFFLCLQRALNY